MGSTHYIGCRRVNRSLKAVLPVLAIGLLLGFSKQHVVHEVVSVDEYAGVVGLSFSADGRYLAVMPAGYDGTDIWDVTTHRVVKHLPESGGPFVSRKSLAFNSNGNQFAICYRGRTIVYNTEDWKSKQLEETGCSAVVFTHDGQRLIVLNNSVKLTEGFHIYVYDADSSQLIGKMRFESLKAEDKTRDICTDRFYANRYANTDDVILIDPKDPQLAFMPKEPGVMALSPDGTKIALSGDTTTLCDRTLPFKFDHTAIVIDIVKRQVLRTIDKEVEALDWSKDSRRLLMAVTDTHVPNDNSTAYAFLKTLDVESGAVVDSEPLTKDLFNYFESVSTTPDGRYQILATRRGVQIWDSGHTKMLEKISVDPASVAISPDGHLLAMGGSHMDLLQDVSPLLSLAVHPHGVRGRFILYSLP